MNTGTLTGSTWVFSAALPCMLNSRVREIFGLLRQLVYFAEKDNLETNLKSVIFRSMSLQLRHPKVKIILILAENYVLGLWKTS